MAEDGEVTVQGRGVVTWKIVAPLAVLVPLGVYGIGKVERKIQPADSQVVMQALTRVETHLATTQLREEQFRQEMRNELRFVRQEITTNDEKHHNRYATLESRVNDALAARKH